MRLRCSGLLVPENHTWMSLAASRLTAAASLGSSTARTTSTHAPTRPCAVEPVGRVRMSAAMSSRSGIAIRRLRVREAAEKPGHPSVLSPISAPSSRYLRDYIKVSMFAPETPKSLLQFAPPAKKAWADAGLPGQPASHCHG